VPAVFAIAPPLKVLPAKVSVTISISPKPISAPFGHGTNSVGVAFTVGRHYPPALTLGG
jgi:hypothetical protein